jgi:hypothetical protein
MESIAKDGATEIYAIRAMLCGNALGNLPVGHITTTVTVFLAALICGEYVTTRKPLRDIIEEVEIFLENQVSRMMEVANAKQIP